MCPWESITVTSSSSSNIFGCSLSKSLILIDIDETKWAGTICYKSEWEKWSDQDISKSVKY